MVAAATAGPRLRWSGREIEGCLVDDQAHASRIEGGDDRTNRRQVELADGSTADHVHLGLAGAIDVGDGPEQGAVRSANLGADDLVPPRLAGLELGVAIERDLEVGGTETLRGAPVPDLLEAEPPAGAVLDRLGVFDRQRRVTALAMQDLADREAILGVVGEDLDANEASQAMCAADPPDDDPSRLAQRDSLRGSRA